MSTDKESENKSPSIGVPIIDAMGAKILEKTANRIKVKMPLAPNCNHLNTMYAGSLFTLAEFPIGALMVDGLDLSKVIPIVAKMEIKFLKPALTDIYTTVELEDSLLKRMEDEAVEQGKSELNHQQELVDESGEVVAVSEAQYLFLRAR